MRSDEISPDEMERTVLISRVIQGPRHLAFRAWTEARHLARWFGPDGFTITTFAFEFRPGGIWDFTMHAPDGTDFPNRIEWKEITPPERIFYWQGGAANDPKGFHTTVTFREVAGGTEITLRSLFQTKEDRNFVVENYGAIEGGRQTLGRLEAYIAELD